MDVIPTTDALDEPTVMRQIRKLVEITDENIQEFANTINEGTYKSVSLEGPVNGRYTLKFVNQNDEIESFNFLVKDIKNITSSQSGSTVNMVITYANNTTQTFSWTAGGDATTNTAQTISAVKTFTVSPIIPSTPSGPTAAVNMSYVESTVLGVNNIVHKSGNEDIAGNKTLTGVTNLSYLGINRVSCAYGKWTKIATNLVNNTIWRDALFKCMAIGTVDYDGSFKVHIPGSASTTRINKVSGGANFTATMVKAGYKAVPDTAFYNLEIWVCPSTRNLIINVDSIGTASGGYGETVWDFTTLTQDNEPDWVNDYDGVIVGVD